MLKTRIIPILLLDGNTVVKSINFDNMRVVGNAMTNVKLFSSRFADEMVILDILATKNKRINGALIQQLSAMCNMPLSVGGGVHSLSDADLLFRSGADKIVINSGFYKNPLLVKEISDKYGSQAVMFSLDVRKENGTYGCYSNSGKVKEEMTAVEAAVSASSYGAGEILLNSIDNDGSLSGYDLELIQKVSKSVTIPVIAAGGCGSNDDAVNAIRSGASAISAGSIFYWIGESILSMKKHMLDNKILVRML